MSLSQAVACEPESLMPETLAELGIWRREGIVARFWWRDDDAVADTPALRRLLDLAGAAGIPLSLAVIPEFMEPGLAGVLDGRAGITVLQHGHSHRNHAPEGSKKRELGNDRPLAEILADVTAGRQRLAAAFGSGFVPAMVPPWNRVSAEVQAALPDAGITGISLFGDDALPTPAGLVAAHTHLDIIDWRGSRGFAGENGLDLACATALRRRRMDAVDLASPIGLLTHHLVHDQACWTFLEGFSTMLGTQQGLRCCPAREIFAAS